MKSWLIPRKLRPNEIYWLVHQREGKGEERNVRHVFEGQTCLRNQRQKKRENKRRDGEVNKKKKKSRKSIKCRARNQRPEKSEINSNEKSERFEFMTFPDLIGYFNSFQLKLTMKSIQWSSSGTIESSQVSASSQTFNGIRTKSKRARYVRQCSFARLLRSIVATALKRKTSPPSERFGYATSN